MAVTKILMNSPKSQKISQVMSQHVPPGAQAYCVELWLQYPFSLKVTPGRVSKLGDYRYDKIRKTHRISVNGTLNPYAFLLTYVHEVAHLLAFEQYGFKISPHGREWKDSFKALMQPLLNSLVFPEDVLQPLLKYMRNPKAASGSDQMLTLALQQYDRQDGSIALAKVNTEQTFRFRKMVLVKESVRRTRALCREVKSGKRYLISQAARVHLLREEKDAG